MPAHPFLGAIFYLLSFAISILTIVLCFRVMMRITRYHDLALIKKNNTAVALVLASSFIALAILARNAIHPVNVVFQDFWFLADRPPREFLLLICRVAGYVILTILLSLGSVAAALLLFQKLTPDLDEELELQDNNVAVALLLAGVLIAFALMVEQGLGDFVSALIPLKELVP